MRAMVPSSASRPDNPKGVTMPRAVDEDRKAARKIEIAEAFSRVMARDGAGLASLRDIADEMGCTIGVLTHHFESKEELYLFTWRYLVGELFGEALGAAGDARGIERLERILVGALPTTPERHDRWRQWMAFLGAAVAGGPIMEEERSSNVRFLLALADELGACVRSGVLPAHMNVETEARALMSLVDGLAVDAVLHPELYPAAEQTAIVRRHLTNLERNAS
jgi:AcrR family transcriptional regulator